MKKLENFMRRHAVYRTLVTLLAAALLTPSNAGALEASTLKEFLSASSCSSDVLLYLGEDIARQDWTSLPRSTRRNNAEGGVLFNDTRDPSTVRSLHLWRMKGEVYLREAKRRWESQEEETTLLKWDGGRSCHVHNEIFTQRVGVPERTGFGDLDLNAKLINLYWGVIFIAPRTRSADISARLIQAVADIPGRMSGSLTIVSAPDSPPFSEIESKTLKKRTDLIVDDIRPLASPVLLSQLVGSPDSKILVYQRGVLTRWYDARKFRREDFKKWLTQQLADLRGRDPRR